MPTTQGTAIIWGCATTGVSYGGVAANVTVTGEDFAKEAQEVLIKDREGSTSTAYYYDGAVTCNLKVYPSGGSASPTDTPSAGQTVTLTSSTDSNLNGTWICTGVSKTRSNEAHVEFDISLKKWDAFTPS